MNTSDDDNDALLCSDADKPFDSSAKADVVLRSSDMVNFFVLKHLLCLVSPIFDSMFSLDVGEAKEKNDTKNGLSIVPIEEDSATLYNMLLLIYPYAKQPIYELSMYMKIGKAVRKYGMDETEKKLKKLVNVNASDMLTKEPLRAFAIAIHFDLVEMVKDAAWNTLCIPLRDLGRCEELRLLSGSEYHDLLQWRFACQDAAEALFVGNSLQNLPGLGTRVASFREELKKTGCPRVAAITDKAITEFISKTLSFYPELYMEILQTCESMMEVIDKAISTVPLTINGTCYSLPPPDQS